MNFEDFNVLMQKHVAGMTKDIKNLFVIDVDKEALWNTYLDSFPQGSNNIFRERREHDCSSCRHFVKSFGNVVSIQNNKIITIWDFETNDSAYQQVADALARYIKKHVVSDVFISCEKSFGIEHSNEKLEDGRVITWKHFYTTIPKTLVYVGTETEDTEKGKLRDIRNVFKRSLEEISEDSLMTVLELISQESLYKGEEHKALLTQFLKLHREYSVLSNEEKENYCWAQSVIIGGALGKIKNHAIGTLLVDITQGTDLDSAVKKYEAMVAPSNYKRPKAIYSKEMLEDARKKIEELGLIDSLSRRYAVLDDITINNILFADKATKASLTGNVFDAMQQGIAVNPKSFNKVEKVNIETFIKDILPQASKVEVMLENKHSGNMVSLIAPQVKDSTTMFKHNNNFSWAYSGNMTDSMKARVKAAGGKVDGVLRFSIQWNEDGKNDNDFDAHCIEPNNNHIYFMCRLPTIHASSGRLDVDIRSPKYEIQNNIAVENITWDRLDKMPEGIYKFYVHNYNHRGGKTGFSAEIEFDNQIFSFSYDKELRNDQRVEVAKVKYTKAKGFEIVESLPSSVSSRDVWGLKTNQFHPVSVCMYSPNYWDLQEGVGNKHYFFMLKDCVNSEEPNGFFNEFLKEDFMKYKHVFEALGSEMRVKPSTDQLSGLGFSSTQRNSLICKVEGSFARTIEITF